MSAKKKEELQLTVGCDPEFFIQDNLNKAFLYPSGVPGSKAAPFHVKDGAIQVDGMAVELNIIPAKTSEEFVSRCKTVFNSFATYWPLSSIKVVPTAEFNPTLLRTLSPAQVELGCIPDFNAYTEEANPHPNQGKNDAELTLRVAGGHIHVGWETTDVNINDPNHIANCYEVIKQLDYYLGVPSLFWDRDNKRRELYGKAGACRIKPYGVEYRTLSNLWFSDERLMTFVFNNSVKAVQDLYKGHRVFDKYGTRAQELINGGHLPDNSWFAQFCDGLPSEYLDGSFLKKKAESAKKPKSFIYDTF